MKMNQVLSTKDIQQILNISQTTAYNLIRQAMASKDMFTVKKIGRDYKIPTQPFLNWLDAQ